MRQVHNRHVRKIQTAPDEVGALVDSLASDQDRLWPRNQWPAMRLDRPLGVGAEGPVTVRSAMSWSGTNLAGSCNSGSPARQDSMGIIAFPSRQRPRNRRC